MHAGFLPLREYDNPELALDIEFENEWGGTSDWNEEDVEAVLEVTGLCDAQGDGRSESRSRPGKEESREGSDGVGGERPMDLSSGGGIGRLDN